MADVEALLERAKDLMKESGALLQGDYLLASGKRSSYYFDSKMFSLNGEGQSLAGELLLELIAPYRYAGFGGMAVSAIPLVGAVARAASDRGLPARGFFVRVEAKEHGTARKIEGFVPPSGSRVVILDDVVTTGGSAQMAVEAAQDRGLEVVLVATLVERHEGGGETFKRQGIDFVSLFKTTVEGELIPAMPNGELLTAAL